MSRISVKLYFPLKVLFFLFFLCTLFTGQNSGTAQETCLQLEAIHSTDQILIDRNHPGSQDNMSGYEGGTVIKIGSTYHLFTSEMFAPPFWQRMRIGYWKSEDGKNWERISTLWETKGDGTDPDFRRGALWSPMPVFDEACNAWSMTYISYEGTANKQGRIWRTVSQTPGLEGIGGPYDDGDIILQPDADTQSWEGDQGTDSFFPYQAGGKWYSFYGSHQYEPAGAWLVGLAESDSLAGPWTRCPTGNPLLFDPVFVENPIVSKIAISDNQEVYLAIYDSDTTQTPGTYDQNAWEIGYTTSYDGIHWAKGSRLDVQDKANSTPWTADIRTPLALIPEEDGTWTLFYTARSRETGYYPVASVRVKVCPVPSPEDTQ